MEKQSARQISGEQVRSEPAPVWRDGGLIFWIVIATVCVVFLSRNAEAAVAPTSGPDTYGVDRVASLSGDTDGTTKLFRGGLSGLAGGAHNDAAVVWQYLARSGHAPSQHLLGTLYLNGWGVEENAATAYAWFVYAANQGLAAAEYRLGLAFFRAGDIAETIKWWDRAAAQAHLPAQYNLGLMYLYGLGVDQDFSLAGQHLERAADRGSAGAQFYLGMMYLKGQGYTEDRQLAAQWLEKSSSAGFSLSTQNIDELKSGWVMPLFAR